MSSADPPPGTEEIPEDEPEAPPYHLMPVAALLGSYAFLACLHLLRRVYVRFKCRESKASTAEAASGRAENPFSALAFQAITVAGAAILYGYIVGIVEAGLAASKVFDPFEILGVATGANTTLIKRAYRQLSLVHHPDKGGSEETFQQVALAYKALSDPIARENWQKHGHPDGPVRASFDFALPSWLLHPQGITAIVLLVLYLGMFVAIIIYAIRTVAKNDEDAVQKHQDMSVARPDQNYLQIMLEDKSTHEDVLYFIATTPENLHMAKKSLVAKEKAVREAAAKKDDKKDEKKKTDSLLDDDDDWDNDGDDDIKQHEASKIEQLKILQAVTGKDTSNEDDDKFEGLHEGVIGQQWVEKKLEAAGAWPPTLSTFSKNAMYNQMMAMAGKENAKMDEDWIKNPAVRRNILFVTARLNSLKLNTDPELLNAGKNNLLEKQYFRDSMAFRNRAGLLMEASLHVAIKGKKAKLAATIVETVAMFKLGVPSIKDPASISWFRTAMEKQYGEGNVPSLDIQNPEVCTPDEDQIANGDSVRLSMDATRTHAEAFTRVKIGMCQRQGIDPRVALNSYREGWWVLIRARPEGTDVEKESLLTAWPVIVQQIASTKAKINVQFPAPEKPGKYIFRVQVKSQEFLGCDQEFEMNVEVADAALVRNREEDYEEKDGEFVPDDEIFKDDKEDEGSDDEDSDDDDDDEDDDDDDCIVVENTDGLRKRPTAGKRE